MKTSATGRKAGAVGVVLAAALLLMTFDAVAGSPRGAYYCTDTSKVFWFVQVSDPHIGTSGSDDSTRLRWVVTTAKSIIQPSFIVASGDLTDSTDGNLFGIPNGPYQSEWNEYKGIVDGAVTAQEYFDLPGNHDAYNDQYFAFYLANSVQGRATGGTQVSWVREFPFGKYHFLGVNTADNTGASFSIFSPYGDHAGLDTTELAFINMKLADEADARLTLVFGHHPVTATGSSQDTYLYYGHREFVSALDTKQASLYGYGHTHVSTNAWFAGNSYTGTMVNGGIDYLNVSSLGKESSLQYALMAIDCDGLSAAHQTVGTWPAVLITAPTAARIGTATNPYSYSVPAAAGNPVRALVFDASAVSSVRFRIDGGTTWHTMTRAGAGSPIWTGTWDASAVSTGLHTLEVQAVGSSTRSHAISVTVTGGNHAPVASNDSYSTLRDTALVVAAPGLLANDVDADGNTLAAVVKTGPAQGTLALAGTAGGFTYTPKAGYTGSDSFTYAASDGVTESAAATVSLSVTTPVTADQITIISATYSTTKKTLAVKATSSQQPNVKLTVYGPDGTTAIGVMAWQAKSKAYSLSVKVAVKPASVVVKSNVGGIATKTVS